MNIFFKNKGGSTVFEIIIAITLITFILFFPVIAFSLMHKKNLLADTLALGLQTVSVEGGLTDRAEHVLLENLSAKGLLPTSPTHPLRQRIRFESNADARGGQTQNLVCKDGPAPKISFTIWYPADAEVSFINRLSRLIGVNNQGAAFHTNVDGETVWYYRMGGYIFSERIEDTLMALPPPAVAPTAIITITPSTNILTTTSITFSDSLSTGSIVAREWQLNSGAVVASPPNGILLAGNHTIRLRVRDSNGLWSDWASRTFEVQAIPVAVLTMNPSTGLITTTNIVFTHNTTSNGVAITGAEWQVNSEAIVTTPSLSRTFPAGNHVVRLRVQNASGVWSEWVLTTFGVAFPPATPIAIELGEFHSFFVRQNGTLWAWGANQGGQLGLGDAYSRQTPVQNPLLTNITSVFAGLWHTFAIGQGGVLWAWGGNGSGQLGNGTLAESFVPIQVPLTNVISAAAGEAHSLALRSDGTVWAWGANENGQLGDRITMWRLDPFMAPLINVASVSAGAFHSFAIKQDRTLWVWGRNDRGQLGDGTTIDRRSPVQIPLTNVASIFAGRAHSLAIRQDGTLWAWGFNGNGQLGDGTGISRSSPVQIPLTNVVSASAGEAHSLALRSDGTVWAWGRNNIGQLGDGTLIDRFAPIQIPLTNVIAISAGSSHSLALRNDGSIWAWGWNGWGQLGDGTTTRRLVPVQVLAPAP